MATREAAPPCTTPGMRKHSVLRPNPQAHFSNFVAPMRAQAQLTTAVLLVAVALVSAPCFASEQEQVCGVFLVQGKLACAANDVKAVRLAKFCTELTGRTSDVCDMLVEEIRSRHQALVKHTETATSCELASPDVEMDHVWYSVKPNAKRMAKRMAGSFDSERLTPVMEQIDAPDGPQSDPEALEAWFVKPTPQRSLRGDAGPGNVQSPVEELLAEAAEARGLTQCKPE